MSTDSTYWKLVGDGTVLWGTQSSAQFQGYVQSVSQTINSDTQQARDANGVVRAECMYNPNAEQTVTVLLNNPAPDPEVGDLTITVNDGIETIGHVVNQSLQSSNVDFKRWVVTIRAYTGVNGETVPANSVNSGTTP